jgi:hypothetical protein
MSNYSKKYIPAILSIADKITQKKELNKSRREYKSNLYHTRKKVGSFKSKSSGHIENAKKIYGINKITASNKLAKKTGCSVKSLRKIIKKGQGAYYSSGSRPNQTAHSWGHARLASSITGGKAATLDYKILEEGCTSKSKALKLAKTAKKKYKGARKVTKAQGGSRGEGGYKMKETIVNFEKGPGDKKYTAIVKNKLTQKIRKLHFGHKDYQQFKDRTNIGLYSRRDHHDKNRQRNYYNRHSGEKKRGKAILKEKKKSKGYYNAKILSHQYLW